MRPETDTPRRELCVQPLDRPFELRTGNAQTQVAEPQAQQLIVGQNLPGIAQPAALPKPRRRVRSSISRGCRTELDMIVSFAKPYCRLREILPSIGVGYAIGSGPGELVAAVLIPQDALATRPKVTLQTATDMPGIESLGADYARLCRVTGNQLPFSLHASHLTWCRHFLNCDPRIEEEPISIFATPGTIVSPSCPSHHQPPPLRPGQGGVDRRPGGGPGDHRDPRPSDTGGIRTFDGARRPPGARSRRGFGIGFTGAASRASCRDAVRRKGCLLAASPVGFRA